MTASTVSFTASPTTVSRRTPILSGEKKSQTESIAKNGEAAVTTNRDLNRGEPIIDRSHGQDLGHVTRRSDTNTTRRTRKVSTPKSEKTRWKRVMRVFAKQLGALLIILGFIQLARKMILKDASPPPPSMAGFESRIAEVDDLIKSTTNTIQVQVELLDKKIERESKTLRKEFETKSSLFQNELKKLESRTDSIQKLVNEVNAKPWVLKSELERVYEELKKGNVDDSAFSIDEMRAYARDMMEKEIEKHVADGLGLVDYALGSGGAFVMLHSDPYHGSNWLGTKRVHTNAVKMLSPSFGEPGQCFALKGSEGYVQIRLRGPIVPEAFTLEHVAKSVAYDRSSAPKDCRVSGWLQGKEQDPSDETEKMQVLTEFSYDLERSNAQTFKVLDSAGFGLVDTVRLDFISNHGSDSHTCIYRFRVHGRAQDPVSVVETQS